MSFAQGKSKKPGGLRRISACPGLDSWIDFGHYVADHWERYVQLPCEKLWFTDGNVLVRGLVPPQDDQGLPTVAVCRVHRSLLRRGAELFRDVLPEPFCRSKKVPGVVNKEVTVDQISMPCLDVEDFAKIWGLLCGIYGLPDDGGGAFTPSPPQKGSEPLPRPLMPLPLPSHMILARQYPVDYKGWAARELLGGVRADGHTMLLEDLRSNGYENIAEKLGQRFDPARFLALVETQDLKVSPDFLCAAWYDVVRLLPSDVGTSGTTNTSASAKRTPQEVDLSILTYSQVRRLFIGREALHKTVMSRMSAISREWRANSGSECALYVCERWDDASNTNKEKLLRDPLGELLRLEREVAGAEAWCVGRWRCAHVIFVRHLWEAAEAIWGGLHTMFDFADTADTA